MATANQEREEDRQSGKLRQRACIRRVIRETRAEKQGKIRLALPMLNNHGQHRTDSTVKPVPDRNQTPQQGKHELNY